MSRCVGCCYVAYLNPPWWVTMGYPPPACFQGQCPAGFQNPGTPHQIPSQTQPPPPGQTHHFPPDQTPPVKSQPHDPGSKAIGVASVTIAPPASVMNPGDAMAFTVSLTGAATTDTILIPIVYQALDNGSYSPIDQSVFQVPQIKVLAGSTTATFEMQYQSQYPSGNYVVSIVTADEASGVADLTKIPVTTFAPFVIQTAEQPGSAPPPTPFPGRQDFSVGIAPAALAFDGTSIWVGNQGRQGGDGIQGTSVSKLSASDGSYQGTFPVTGSPWAVLTAGTTVWVGSFDSSDLTSSGGHLTAFGPLGDVLQEFDVPGQLTALASIQYDGVPEPSIYFVGLAGDILWRLDPTTGAVQGVGPVGGHVQLALLFDGTNIWSSNAYSNTVSKMDNSGVLQSTFQVGKLPGALAFDGNCIWVANAGDNTVAQLRVSDGHILNIIATGRYPSGIAFDGANVWVTNGGDNSLTQIRVSDGVVLGTFATGPTPGAVLFDGAHIWVANYGSNTVSRY